MQLFSILDENNYITHCEWHTECPQNGTPLLNTQFKTPRLVDGVLIEGATAEELAEKVPTQITAIKFLVQLELEGVTEANILAIINTLPEPSKTIATVSFNRATFFERDNQLLLLVGQAYGFNSTKLDEIFINANKLPI
jgi:hypothetical protein